MYVHPIYISPAVFKLLDSGKASVCSCISELILKHLILYFYMVQRIVREEGMLGKHAYQCCIPLKANNVPAFRRVVKLYGVDMHGFLQLSLESLHNAT